MENYKTITFNDYIKYTSLNEFMTWDSYDLVENNLPEFAIDEIREKAIKLLCRNYGHFNIGVELVNNTGDYPTFYFPEFEADLMTFFPELVQSLSITLKMLGINVPETDIITETFDRTEEIISNQTSDNTNNSETDITNNNTNTQNSTSDTTQTNNSTILNTGTSINDIKYEREITNTSEVEETGNRSVNLSHQMPEQAITGTGNFIEDSQGTPILSESYVQSANENFSTLNPMQTSETSVQRDIENTQTTTNDLSQTNESLNDVFVKNDVESEENSIGKSTTNESLKSVTNGQGENIIHDVRKTEKTNPLFANEISKFLENVQDFNAFDKFVNKFSWLCGIL